MVQNSLVVHITVLPIELEFLSQVVVLISVIRFLGTYMPIYVYVYARFLLAVVTTHLEF